METADRALLKRILRISGVVTIAIAVALGLLVSPWAFAAVAVGIFDFVVAAILGSGERRPANPYALED